MTRGEMACQELVEAVTDFVEGALSNADRARFDEHLGACRGCRTYLDQTATWPGHWSAPPTPWDEVPEDRLSSGETLAFVRAAMAALPPAQREVITLRDVEGRTSKEVCNALKITETNQRVLLHRARSSVRRALEGYLAPEG